jgi:hypothetical protein
VYVAATRQDVYKETGRKSRKETTPDGVTPGGFVDIKQTDLTLSGKRNPMTGLLIGQMSER